MFVLRYISWLVLLSYIHCRVFYVNNGVSVSKETGGWNQPFTTIQACVNALKNPGDQCQIRKGTYHEEIKVSGLHGNPDKPIIIQGYKEERPKLDGTIEIIPTTKWTNKGTGSVYRAKIPTKIWQLFLDGEMMTNARWPNGKWSDKSIFLGTKWPTLSETSKRGLIVNKGNSLANTNINMTDALAILNIGSFNTFVAKVKNHKAKSNRFQFDDNFGSFHFKPKRSRYFLEDKLELLDSPEEWFYDQKSKYLHLWTPKGTSPENSKLRGKVQSYAMVITDSSHLILKNIDFFATALKADSTNSSYKVNNITFHSLNFKHHTYSKRMLGDIGLIDWLDVNGIYDRRHMNTWGTFTFFNNTFYGSDGLALSYHGANVAIANNLFEYNDFTAANMIVGGGGLGTIKSDSVNDTFVRNTLRYNGASVGIRPGLNPIVKLNDITKQCWGLIQNDGAGVQLTTKPQLRSRLEKNWVYNQPKYGLRFDGEPPKIGIKGTMVKNVVGKCNGMMIKGDYHRALYNLAFDKENANDDDKQGAGCALCVLKYVRTNPVSINNHSEVLGNIADVANGGKIIGGNGEVYPVAGSLIKKNIFGKNVNKILKDPYNFDFRPIDKKINVGPYPYQKEFKRYWIPGRKLYKASTPIPPHKSESVIADNRDVLMWLNAFNTKKHKVYFKMEELKKSEQDVDLEYIGTVTGDDNVIQIKQRVSPNRKYYWRVDAVKNDSKGSEIVYKGDTWWFKTM